MAKLLDRCVRCLRHGDGHGYDSAGISGPRHDYLPIRTAIRLRRITWPSN
jgi:hypothetical protein